MPLNAPESTRAPLSATERLRAPLKRLRVPQSAQQCTRERRLTARMKGNMCPARVGLRTYARAYVLIYVCHDVPVHVCVYGRVRVHCCIFIRFWTHWRTPVDVDIDNGTRTYIHTARELV